MEEIRDAFGGAFLLLIQRDTALLEIVFLSLRVSLTALFFASLIGLPLGSFLGSGRFPGRNILVVLLNSMLGLPPVVVGLTVYLVLSRSGPLGGLDWLFTSHAMIIAQFILVTPFVASITRQTVEDLMEEYEEQLTSLGVGKIGCLFTLLHEGRYRLLTALLAGFGRAISEVGAVMIVGGNIAHLTRVMTTAIAMETSKGDLTMALSLGIILIFLALSLNVAAQLIAKVGRA
ncbi:ABC transporter permease [Myxococcota bacterium]|nr:ABC transporter permease [Myxococcota bacterium]